MKLTVTRCGQKPLRQYILDNLCTRRGRCESYLETVGTLGIDREEIEKPKRDRLHPLHKLTHVEIQDLILGCTLRRPCFDLHFEKDGYAKCSWVDSLDDTPKHIENHFRERLGLTKKLDESWALPMFHEGRWWFDSDGHSLYRDFGSCYGRPLQTEFFYQDNGLLSVKSHNDNHTIWYDLIVFDNDLIDDSFCVHWREVEQYMNMANNNLREYSANSVPQFLEDQFKRAW